MTRWIWVVCSIVLILPVSYGPAQSTGLAPESVPFTFAVTADMRNYAGPGNWDTPEYFRGAAEAIAAREPTAFMVSPGDIDPPADVLWTISQTLGPSYMWYPVAGNHETETLADMVWLRAYDYGTVNPGPSGCPETTYSFDHGNAHFVMLNEYCDAAGDSVTNGDIPDHLYDWLAADLQATQAKYVFVFGHEPAFPQPDADNGRIRHAFDSLNANTANRDRFWALLKSEGVTAYICGHTHNYSVIKLHDVWQMDAGHARGLGDNGARSTFLLVRVHTDGVAFEAYRDDNHGGAYTLRQAGILAGKNVFLPVFVNP